MTTQSTARSKEKVVIERTYAADLEVLWDLWTTKKGFESWWGPEGFRADVKEIDPREGGALRYDMVAHAPEMIEMMKKMGQPVSHGTRARFSAIKPRERIVLTNVIDFLPGVTAYEADMAVDFIPTGDRVRMVVTLDALHSGEFSKMQREGMTSQLTKLDKRFG